MIQILSKQYLCDFYNAKNVNSKWNFVSRTLNKKLLVVLIIILYYMTVSTERYERKLRLAAPINYYFTIT